MTLTVLRSPGQVSCRISFNLCLSDVFLIIRLGFCVLEVKCHFHHILSRVHTMHMTYCCWCWPWSRGGGNVCQVSPCKVPLSPSFPCCPLRKEVPMHSSPLRMGTASHPPRRKNICINCLVFFCMRDLSLLSHLFTSVWIFFLFFNLCSYSTYHRVWHLVSSQ